MTTRVLDVTETTVGAELKDTVLFQLVRRELVSDDESKDEYWELQAEFSIQAYNPPDLGAWIVTFFYIDPVERVRQEEHMVKRSIEAGKSWWKTLGKYIPLIHAMRIAMEG